MYPTQPITASTAVSVSCSSFSPSPLAQESPAQTDYSLSPWTQASASDLSDKEKGSNKVLETLIAKTSELSLVVSSPLSASSGSAQFPLSSTSMQSLIPPPFTLTGNTPFSKPLSEHSVSPSLSPNPSVSCSPHETSRSMTSSPLPVMTAWSSLTLSTPSPLPIASSSMQTPALSLSQQDSSAQSTSLRSCSSAAELSKEATREISVLVVDDESANRNILMRSLKKSGVKEITQVASGEEALEKLLVFPYQVVFMDNRMGANRKRGLDTIIEYRGMTSQSAKINQAALFYLWTTDPEESFDSAVLQKHRIVFLKKPTSPLLVNNIIKSASRA